MEKHILIALIALLSISCNGQDIKSQKNEVETPKGTWKVDKEFDERGRLIKFDSIYSWSSHNPQNNLSLKDQDSIIQAFKAQFFIDFLSLDSQDIEDTFSQDYLCNDDFFGNHFQKDFGTIDDLRKQMITEHQKLLKKHQSAVIKRDTDD